MNFVNAIPPQNLNTVIQDCLFSDCPDVTNIYSILESDYGLSRENARTLIYQVVSLLNAKYFPPICKVEIVHTEGCNLGCSYCFEKNMLGYKKMSTEVARAAIDLLFAYSRDVTHLTITHFGGEPTLNFPGIQFTTEYAEEKAVQAGKTVEFHMTSNGVLINEDMAEYFARHQINVLLSCDGLEKSHNSFRLDKAGRGTFEQVMRCLKLLKRTQKWIGIKMTVMPVNAGHLYEDVLGLYEKGVNQFLIGYATGIKWSEEDMRTYVDQLGKLNQWYKQVPHDNLKITEFDEDTQVGFFGCQAGRSSISVAVNGEVSPCSKIMGIDNKNLLAKFGDIHHGLIHMRNRLDLVSCSRLRVAAEQKGIAKEYQGGCFASNYDENLDLFQPNMQDHMFSVLQRSICGGCSSR